MAYTMTPAECRNSYRYPSNRRSFDTLEAYARACGVDLDRDPPAPEPLAKTPAAKAAPKPSRVHQSMAGEFARFLASAPPPEPEPPADPARAAWQADADLRAEFDDNFARYDAYHRAAENGRAHHHGASPYAA